MKRMILIVTLLLLSSSVFSQSVNNFNKVWIQGIVWTFRTTFDGLATPVNEVWDSTTFLLFTCSHSNICDSNGNLILACNGFDLYNGNHTLIDNGDTLIPELYYDNKEGWVPMMQSSIILPFDSGIYYLFTATTSDSVYSIYNGPELDDQLLYHVVDMHANSGLGSVVRKGVPLMLNANLSKTQMTACRHGNGKDWWLLKQSADSNLIYKFLVTRDSVYGPFLQGFNFPVYGYVHMDHMGQSAFSPDGNKYATGCVRSNQIFLADFDRCTGILSNAQQINGPLVYSDDTTGYSIDTFITGLCFSPNSAYLYTLTSANICQLDLSDPDSSSAWYRVAGEDTLHLWFPGYNGLGLGQDNKIYIGNAGGYSGAMSAIDNPNEKGIDCNYCRRCLRFPQIFATHISADVQNPPNMPNYALGPDPDCSEAVNHVGTRAGAVCIYPNPSSGNITIEYPAAGTIEISNALGQVIFATTLYAAFQSAQVDLSKLPAGIYTYHYLSTDGKIQKAGKLSLVQ